MVENKSWLNRNPNIRNGLGVILVVGVVFAAHQMFGDDRVWSALVALGEMVGVHIQDVPTAKE